MGITKESTGSYQMGFATFGVIAAVAFALVVLHRTRWMAWALPQEGLVAAKPIQTVGVRVDSGV
jgi:NNP family nitrate/nitrite transporter-like MFS transporter